MTCPECGNVIVLPTNWNIIIAECNRCHAHIRYAMDVVKPGDPGLVLQTRVWLGEGKALPK